MVVNQLHIEKVSAFETEYDSPVGAYGHGPEVLAVAFQWMEAIAGKVEGSRAVRSVQRSQNILDPANEICSDLTAVALLVEPLKPLVLKTHNHPNVSVQ
jgi:hypothetical protein